MGSLVQRYIDGEPLAYLMGDVGFYGLVLDITKDVLIPRPDTELLVREAVSALQTIPDCRILDLCSGSGCVGLAIASQIPSAQVILGELSADALKVCRQNIRKCGLSDRVTSAYMDALLPPSGQQRRLHCIVSNPPYIPHDDIAKLDPSVRDYEPHMALDGGADGLDFYRSIAKHWGRLLMPDGLLIVEIGIGQAKQVTDILDENSFANIQVYDDYAGIPRVVSGVCKV